MFPPPADMAVACELMALALALGCSIFVLTGAEGLKASYVSLVLAGSHVRAKVGAEAKGESDPKELGKQYELVAAGGSDPEELGKQYELEEEFDVLAMLEGDGDAELAMRKVTFGPTAGAREPKLINASSGAQCFAYQLMVDPSTGSTLAPSGWTVILWSLTATRWPCRSRATRGTPVGAQRRGRRRVRRSVHHHRGDPAAALEGWREGGGGPGKGSRLATAWPGPPVLAGLRAPQSQQQLQQLRLKLLQQRQHMASAAPVSPRGADVRRQLRCTLGLG